MFRPDIDIRKIAFSSSGNPDLLPGLSGMINDQYLAASFPCLYGAHQSRGTGPYYDDINCTLVTGR